MTHVSKNKLSQEAEKSIHKRFIKTVSNLKNENGTELFFDDLLTETEQIMLAKRLAIIFLLTEGLSFYRIQKILKVSSSTVSRINGHIKNGSLDNVIILFKKKQNREIFWAELEVLLRLGMPSMGRQRWKWLDEFYENKK